MKNPKPKIKTLTHCIKNKNWGKIKSNKIDSPHLLVHINEKLKSNQKRERKRNEFTKEMKKTQTPKSKP